MTDPQRSASSAPSRLKGTKVLISGASIAGPALALWLARYGCAVTVVERAPKLRTGGQAVDFKGDTHRTVLARMGVWDEVNRRQTGGHDQTVIDAAGRRLATIPGTFTGGDVEILRGDLSQILYDRTAADCEYVFGDSIASMSETPDGIDVTFERAAPRSFDLVVGADGIHSTVRRLAFGPEDRYVTYLGHYYALADLDGGDGGDGPVMYNEPGRMIAVGGPKAPAFFVFASDPLDFDRFDTARQKQLLREAYRGARWRVPELMTKVPDCRDFYMDSLSLAAVDEYSTGRVVLVGDSAYGNTLGGFGTGLAIVGAYVLAGELKAADGDHRAAFAAYQRQFLPYAKATRRTAAGPFLAPGSALRMTMRNWTFKSRILLGLMMRTTDRFATDIALKDY